jgi:nucleoside-diphosphate-sugar epimerase
MSRSVIIFGATGKTGSLISEELVAKHIKTSVFVREKSAHKISNSLMEIKYGDVLNQDDVDAAFKDGEYTYVVIALGTRELKNVNIRSKGTKHIIEAMVKYNCKANIHVISALGIGNSWRQLKWHSKLISNILIKRTMNDHTEQEKHIMNSPFHYHILRPVALSEGQAIGEVHVQNDGFLPSNTIRRADVANYLVKSLIHCKTGISAICQKTY